jgi:hypothetical protein
MRRIVEELGNGMIAILAVVGMIALYHVMLLPGGSLYEAVVSFMGSLCGQV